MRIMIFVAGVALLLPANASSAQPGSGMGGGRGHGPMISNIDVNSDGFVSADEHREWAGKVFATMDANKDGKISVSEFRKWRHPL